MSNRRLCLQWTELSASCSWIIEKQRPGWLCARGYDELACGRSRTTQETHLRFPLSCRIFESQSEAHTKINVLIRCHLWSPDLSISLDDDMAFVSIGLGLRNAALRTILVSSHEVALCGTDQPTLIQLLDIRWDACSHSLPSPLRYTHVSRHPLFGIALTSALSSESPTYNFYKEIQMQLPRIVSDVFVVSITWSLLEMLYSLLSESQAILYGAGSNSMYLCPSRSDRMQSDVRALPHVFAPAPCLDLAIGHTLLLTACAKHLHLISLTLCSWSSTIASKSRGGHNNIIARSGLILLYCEIESRHIVVLLIGNMYIIVLSYIAIY